MKKMLSNPKAFIAGLFTISTFFVLPLFWGHDYTVLFDRKYVYYYVTALITIGLFIIVTVYTFIKDQTWDKPRLQTWELTLLIFTGSCILSTLFSDFPFEAFWGNEGRCNGLFLMLLYCLPAYIIGRHLNMKQWYLDVLLVSGLLVCLYGITDYFRMDIFGAKVLMNRTAEAIFTSSMGNINFYTAYVALIVGCSTGLFLTEGKLPRRIFYYLCYVISLFAIITGTSDNAYLSLGAIWALAPLYALRRKITAKRLLLLFTSSMIILLLVSWINEKWEARVIAIDSLLTELGETRGMLIFAIVMAVLTAIVYIRWSDRKQRNPQLPPLLRRIWLVAMGAVLLFILGLLYDANLAGNGTNYGSLQKYLVFNDQWGTQRGYSWRIAWEYFVKFSPLHKLFGYGLETYPILNIYNNKREMAYVFETFYDSVHNEYLQYLIGIGILGLASYLLFFAAVIKTLFRNLTKTPYILGIILPLIAYWTQAVVNISTVYIAAVMWMLIGSGMAACRSQPAAAQESDPAAQDILPEM